MNAESDIVRALQVIRPGAEYALSGDSYAGLLWLDQVQTKPTETELNAAIAALPDAKQVEDDEAVRIATFAEDPELTDGLTAIKSGTAQEVDAYVDSVIVLTATDIDALRLEVQTALRGILRRQLKVQFDPTTLLGQLDAAKKKARKT